jgi:hypothetical protein
MQFVSFFLILYILLQFYILYLMHEYLYNIFVFILL